MKARFLAIALCFLAALALPAQAAAQASPAMVLVPGGTFSMGAADDESYVAEEPTHPVSLRPFYLGAKEVTVAEFRSFAESTGYRSQAERGPGAWILSGKTFALDPAASWRSPGFAQADDEPVLCVSWNDAIAYCNALSLAQDLEPAYRGSDGLWTRVAGANGYRLPSEAEWEYAAGGGATRTPGRFPGKGAPALLGWELENSGGRSHPVGLKSPNALGLFDLCGNAWEWCDDFYGQRYYAESPEADPAGPASGATKCVRGGSWASRPRNCRVTQRYARDPGQSYSYLGFRLARSAE
jgi:formylglycine-generating enzyme